MPISKVRKLKGFIISKFWPALLIPIFLITSACVEKRIITIDSPVVEYGCWCKNYRISELPDQDPVDGWDKICQKHVVCYTSGDENQHPYCDNLFVNQIQEEANITNIMPLNIKLVFEYYWEEFYGKPPVDYVFKNSRGRIYFYEGRMLCE